MPGNISERFPAFLAEYEGCPTRAYKCPAGVITIGLGFTNRSKAFRTYWVKTRGHQLRMGDTITAEESFKILPSVMDDEYLPPVRAVASKATQHAFDAAASVSFNCGPGSLKWKWAQALAVLNYSLSASRLKTTAVTANGRRLRGLVRRRAAEARVLLNGDYGTGKSSSVSTAAEDVKQYQGWLRSAGDYKGSIDGIAGPKTIGAVKLFQKRAGLVVDGVVGPATRAALIRAVDTRSATISTAGAGGGGAAAGGGISAGNGGRGDLDAPAGSLPPSGPETAPDTVSGLDAALLDAVVAGAVLAALVVVAFLIWRNRGRLLGNRRVPT